MLKIDKNIFAKNLRLTQKYCRLQKDNKDKDNATIFRSYNPMFRDKPMFSFKVEHFDFDIEPNLNYCTLTKWAIDPTERDNDNLIDTLFKQQINFKEKQIIIGKKQTHLGDILVSQIDCTVIDGASEVQSLGLIDVYDIPPIDTWFYLTRNEQTRLLFAWIPIDFRHYANEAVLVNCVDCMNWFQEWYPQDYKEVITN